jgi:CubicO group peptidase (beta-lactamase class C family)
VFFEATDIASIRKSVLSMLIGIEADKGTIRPQMTLSELGIDDLGGLSDAERQATVADLLTSRSGVFHPASNPGDSAADLPARGTHLHGTYFIYNNWDFNTLGTIFELQSRRAIDDALEAELAVPLQFEDFSRSAQKKSGDEAVSRHLAYHMWLSTRDTSRQPRGRWATGICGGFSIQKNHDPEGHSKGPSRASERQVNF